MLVRGSTSPAIGLSHYFQVIFLAGSTLTKLKVKSKITKLEMVPDLKCFD